MAVLLALMSAAAYGASDFLAGLASRRHTAGAVAGCTQLLGVIATAVAVALFGGIGVRAGALEWGALGGLGSAVGTLALYRGFTAGQMSVVATTSAVLTAAIPVLVGVALGNRLGVLAVIGVLIAIPSIVLVSWHPDGSEHAGRSPGALYGIVSGLGFALLFIGLDRAGTMSGAWPLLSGEVVSLVLVAPLAFQGLRALGVPGAGVLRLAAGAGVLSAAANILYFAATGHGELSIVAVLGALYPVLTVILARVILSERWTRLQVAGLLTAAVAIVLVAS